MLTKNPQKPKNNNNNTHTYIHKTTTTATTTTMTTTHTHTHKHTLTQTLVAVKGCQTYKTFTSIEKNYKIRETLKHSHSYLLCIYIGL